MTQPKVKQTGVPKMQNPPPPPPPPSQAKKADPKPVDEATYNRFTDLKFLQLSETPLTQGQKDELASLEAELLKCTGKKPIRTVRAAIQNEQALLVTGIPVPASIETLIGETHAAYYFGV